MSSKKTTGVGQVACAIGLFAVAGAAAASQTGVCDEERCHLYGDGVLGVGNSLITFENGVWTFPSQASVTFGAAGDIPAIGDWNNNGTMDLGFYREGTWYFRQDNPDGTFETTTYVLGATGGVPVVGDWTGDGRDGIGVVMGVRWFLISDVNGGGTGTVADLGSGISEPLVGDWNGDGIDTMAIVDDGVMYYRNENATGSEVFTMDVPSIVAGSGYRPVAWNTTSKGGTSVILDVLGFSDPLNSNVDPSQPVTGGGAIVIVVGPGGPHIP